MRSIGICDVHKWAKKDENYREVIYCSTCKAWICDECRPNKTLRARAMLNRSLKVLTKR